MSIINNDLRALENTGVSIANIYASTGNLEVGSRVNIKNEWNYWFVDNIYSLHILYKYKTDIF